MKNDSLSQLGVILILSYSATSIQPAFTDTLQLRDLKTIIQATEVYAYKVVSA